MGSNLHIYNTFDRKKVPFHPINPPYVGMYVCGPTVYGHSHLGHALSYTVFDVMYRYLLYSGYKVRYVQNITDVGHLVADADDGEDKIAKQASLEKQEPVEIAYKYEVSYFEDMEKLNILKPSLSCRATGHMIEIINHVQALIDKGHAYATKEGNVYFDIRSFDGYGKLSGRKLEDMQEGGRIEIAGDKRHAEDFALWKKAEAKHLMKWDSPWGKGYPGWHIECTVMAQKYLGETFDIHGGGMENTFPHHECEIAQGEALTGKTLVNYFIHNNLLTVDGTKMGKSLGNFIILKDLFKDIEPVVLRFYILMSHYRSPLDFTNEAMQAATSGFTRLRNSVSALKQFAGHCDIKGVVNKTYDDVDELKKKFIAAMDDDFNTPVAISILYDILKISNNELNKTDKDQGKLLYVHSLIKDFAEDILGFNFDSEEKSSLEDKLIELLITLRSDFRNEKNFAMSDKIRDELAGLGVILKDGPTGTTFSK